MQRRLPTFVLLCAGFLAASCRAQDVAQSPETPAEAVSKYPLRLHVLAIDDTHRTGRMQPNWCGGSMPDMSGGDDTGGCSSSGSASLGGGEDDLSGAGRADLVTPPQSTVGLNFTYEGCSRVRVAPGFSGLEARWIKPGKKLEVMIPTDALSDGPLKTQRCTLKVDTQEFVYLRLRNGSIVRVTQDAYLKKPSLRRFLSGGAEKLERRTPAAVTSR